VIPVLVNDRVALLCGDSKALDLGEGVIDAVVCDPPYELGFMGKKWDASGIAYDVALWKAIYRVLKPGGHLLAFGGTRTYHRMACAIEDAGFEIRDSLHWVYGSGFPKSLNVSKAIDEKLGAERPVTGPNPNHRAVSGVEYEGVYAGGNTGAASLTAPGSPEAERWSGWGTALKPAHEPIILARKPLVDSANGKMTVAECVLAHGTGGLNVDGCRIGTDEELSGGKNSNTIVDRADGWGMRTGGAGEYVQPTGRWPANFVLSHSEGCEVFAGYGPTAGEGIACAPGCPVAELDRQSGPRAGSGNPERPVTRGGSRASDGWGLAEAQVAPGARKGSVDGASRFFYVAKPSARERDYGCEALPASTGGEATDRVDGSAGLESPRAGAGRKGGRRNTHPTVKPVELMRWLVRLITPPGGTVLDPFLGSGTTGIAAVREGLSFVGVEMSPEYIEIAKARITRALEEAK
jgi:DNA modification methylase